MNIAGIGPVADFGYNIDQAQIMNSSNLQQTIPQQLNCYTTIAQQLAPSTSSSNNITISSNSSPLANGGNSPTLQLNLLASATNSLLQSLPSDSEADKQTKERCLYLQQLLKEKKQCQLYPSVFMHADRLLDEGKSTRLRLFVTAFSYRFSIINSYLKFVSLGICWTHKQCR